MKGYVRSKKSLRNWLEHRPFSLQKFRKNRKLGATVLRIPSTLGRPRPSVIKNQRNTRLCTAFTAWAMRAAKYGRQFSPDWFAKEEHRLTLGRWEGAPLRVQARVMIKAGILPAEESPFRFEDLGEDFVVDPRNWNENLNPKAISFKARSYLQADGQYDMFDNLRTALTYNDKDGEGISVALEWFEEWNFIPPTGILPFPLAESGFAHNVRFYDFVTILGKDYLIFENYEGDKWGDHGIGYMSRDLANKFIYTGADAPLIFIDEDPEELKKELWGYLEKLKSILLKLLNLVSPPPPIVQDPPKPAPLPEPPAPPAPKYNFGTRDFAISTCRLITQEEGLDDQAQGDLLATIHAESNFDITIRKENKDGTWDNGICQFNSYWYKHLISPERAVSDPEFAVRLMCKQWKAGHKNDWVAYKNGLYLKYRSLY